MTNDDKAEFRDTMSMVCELYSKTMSKQMLQVYFGALVRFTIEDIKKGVGEHLSSAKHGSYFPKPADIIRGIEGDELSPSEEFRQYLRSIGRKVEF